MCIDNNLFLNLGTESLRSFPCIHGGVWGTRLYYSNYSFTWCAAALGYTR